MLIPNIKGAQFLPLPTSVVFWNQVFHLAFLLPQGRHTQFMQAKTPESQQSWWKPMLPKAFLWPTPLRKGAQVCCDSWHQDLPSSWEGLVPDSASTELAPPSLSQKLPSGGCSHSAKVLGSIFAPAHIRWRQSTKAIRNVWVKSYCLDYQSHHLPHFYVVTPEGSKIKQQVRLKP